MRARNGIKSIIRNGGLLVGTTWIDVALRFVYLLAITRVLGVENYGVWAYALSAYAVAIGVVSFGLENLVPIHLGADKTTTRRFAASALFFRGGLLTLALLCLVAFAILSEGPGQLRNALLLAAPALVGRGVASLVRSVFVGMESVGAYFRMAVAVRVLEVVIGLSLLAMGADVLAVLAVHSISWCVEAALGIWMLRRLPKTDAFALNAGFVRSLARDGLQLGIIAAIGAFMTAGPVLMARFLSDRLDVLAQVALCLQITSLFAVTGSALLQAALPVLSRTKAAGDDRIALYAPSVAFIALGFAAPGAAIGFLFGPSLFTALFGQDFAAAGALLGPAIIIAGLMIAPSGYAQTLMLHKKFSLVMTPAAIGALSFVMCAFLLQALYGAAGMVIAAGAGWLIRAILIIALGAARADPHLAGPAQPST